MAAPGGIAYHRIAVSLMVGKKAARAAAARSAMGAGEIGFFQSFRRHDIGLPSQQADGRPGATAGATSAPIGRLPPKKPSGGRPTDLQRIARFQFLLFSAGNQGAAAPTMAAAAGQQIGIAETLAHPRCTTFKISSTI